jgi:S1-C subfamily serine protease
MEIDGEPVDRSDAITRVISRKRPGDSVVLTISRGGRTAQVKVPLRAARE